MSERFEEIQKLADLFIAGLFLLWGILTLGGAVIFIFLYFSAVGIIMAAFLFSIYGLLILIFYLFTKSKRFRKILNRFSLKKNQE